MATVVNLHKCKLGKLTCLEKQGDNFQEQNMSILRNFDPFITVFVTTEIKHGSIVYSTGS